MVSMRNLSVVILDCNDRGSNDVARNERRGVTTEAGSGKPDGEAESKSSPRKDCTTRRPSECASGCSGTGKEGDEIPPCRVAFIQEDSLPVLTREPF
jgi:hypothetical protein